MEPIILADGDYLYYPQYNELINSEFKYLFRKFSKQLFESFGQQSFDLNMIHGKLKSVRQLIFQVTQDCNLRCKYCSFSGSYYYKRDHSKKYMTFEIAKEGLNRIFNLIGKRLEKKLSLGFYGGEPLLSFDLIKKIVAYAERKFCDFELGYFLTTNGTILNDEYLKYFVEKDFRILVSLDGPAVIHNQHRVFQNGGVTHEFIMENLIKIESLFCDFFLSNVSLNATFPEYIKIQDYYDYFSDHPLLNKLNISVGLVDWRDTNFYNDYEKYENCRKEAVHFVFPKIKHKLRKKLPLNSLEKSIIKPYRKIGEALKLRNFSPTSGACLFDSRVFLDCSGKFHVCERISSNLPIGNIENGFDLEKMQNIIDEFCGFVRNFCSKCVARAFCRICYANVERKGKFELDHLLCRKKIGQLKNLLSEFIELKKEGF